MTWLLYALASAVAAAATAILAKVGVEGVPSTLATAFRTTIVLVIAWGLVLVLGEREALLAMPRRRGSSSRCRASRPASRGSRTSGRCSWGRRRSVAPIDKLSLPLTIVLAAVVLGESIGWKVAAGVAMMTAGALLTIM